MSTNKNDFFIPSKLRSHTKTSKMENGEVKAVPKESKKKKKKGENGAKCHQTSGVSGSELPAFPFQGLLECLRYILYYAI